MNIKRQARTLAMASMLALAVISIPVAQGSVHAQKNEHPTDNGIRCSFQNPRNGEWLFFLPGESITLTDGLGYSYKVTCGDDGNWTIASRGSNPTFPATGLQITPLPMRSAGGS